jgi:hypothetical protein
MKNLPQVKVGDMSEPTTDIAQATDALDSGMAQ